MPGGYPGLKQYWPQLKLNPNPRVLVPLCGKSPDLAQLEEFGAAVTGVEISQKAILEFFEEQERQYDTESYAGFTIYHSGEIELWQGDFFKFPEHPRRDFDLIYDKAALVALPDKKRQTYAQKILCLAHSSTSVLLHHFLYPQKEMTGPPFSVLNEEISNYFSEDYHIQLLERNKIPASHFPPFQRRGLKSPLEERLLYITPAAGN